ncbi:g10758 [Coccomyxa elongata]
MAAWKWRPTTRLNQAVLPGPTTTTPPRRPCMGASRGATEAATDEPAAESADESPRPIRPTNAGAVLGALYEAATYEPAAEPAHESSWPFRFQKCRHTPGGAV